ncbi:hypothetical protein [Shouchella hunanensis]|uniref:Polymerase nucleotidyl transferase domain-containing protein n=1 Tax=Shouchella hunanensis TaxID=766894 RepID=A0ABY7W0M4_9BACI|nr:hypothetical protein [Shouchella hunanensis]WDF02404.1 hypothetical protein PQ477_12825 [Shouchella hunanensis]GAF21948.1 hypothetical protein JCM19047_1672 [Bacillus sp. JCM 19047]
MNTQDAIAIAREWVQHVGSHQPGFKGAYLAGSVLTHPRLAPWPVSSDVDIMIISTKVQDKKLGKFIYKGLLLEVTTLDYRLFLQKETILADYHVGYSFAHTIVLSDVDDVLVPLQTEVARDFYHMEWVHRRCEHVKEKSIAGLTTIPTSAPFHEQVMSWLFPTGVLAHLFLTAALENPTVRKRYTAVQAVLKRYNMEDVHETLLKQLRVESLTKMTVQSSLDQLEETFVLAVEHAKTPFFFSTDVTHSAKPIVIEGSQLLINKNQFRESFFWIIATFCRCHIILAHDAPHLHEKRLPYFKQVLSSIGITTEKDLYSAALKTLSTVDYFWDHTRALIENNPDIIHEKKHGG